MRRLTALSFVFLAFGSIQPAVGGGNNPKPATPLPELKAARDSQPEEALPGSNDSPAKRTPVAVEEVEEFRLRLKQSSNSPGEKEKRFERLLKHLADSERSGFIEINTQGQPKPAPMFVKDVSGMLVVQGRTIPLGSPNVPGRGQKAAVDFFTVDELVRDRRLVVVDKQGSVAGRGFIVFNDRDMRVTDLNKARAAMLRSHVDELLTLKLPNEALQELEELIDVLKQERDRLAARQQETGAFKELEQAKSDLGRAHLQAGLLSQMVQARRHLLELEAGGRNAREIQLAEARLKLAEIERRFEEARGK